MPPQGASHLLRARVPVATTGLGPLAAVDSADRAAREEHIARAKASSRACRALNLAKKEGQVGTRYGLRRVFEQERRPFMLAIKAAASSGGRLR